VIPKFSILYPPHIRLYIFSARLRRPALLATRYPYSIRMLFLHPDSNYSIAWFLFFGQLFLPATFFFLGYHLPDLQRD
jgi:hypothetical protein